MTEHQAVTLIMAELGRARRKFPYWPDDQIHAAAIVGEEAGELIQAAVQMRYEGGTLDHCMTEALHTAATAIRFMVEATTTGGQKCNR